MQRTIAYEFMYEMLKVQTENDEIRRKQDTQVKNKRVKFYWTSE